MDFPKNDRFDFKIDGNIETVPKDG